LGTSSDLQQNGNKTKLPHHTQETRQERRSSVRERGGIKQRKEIEISSNQGEKKQSSTTTTMVSVSAAASI
jgi:hypothetical protein